MSKGRDVTGKAVVSDNAGNQIDVVEDLIFNQSASDQRQQTAPFMGETLEEMGQFASDHCQDGTQLTNERLQSLGHFDSETAQDLAQPQHGLGRAAATAMTHAIIDPTAQKDFVTGKVANREVITPTGSLFALQGQPITHELAAAAQSLGILDDLYRAVGGSWTVLGTGLAAAVSQSIRPRAGARSTWCATKRGQFWQHRGKLSPQR